MSTTKNSISLTVAVIIGINAMIGAGIFTIPAELMNSVGPAGLITMILVSCGVWFLAQSFAQLAQYNPQEGSLYTYAKAWGGRRAGEIATVLYLSGMIIAMGLLCKVSGSYLHKLIPAISTEGYALAVLATVTLLTMFGVHISTAGQYIMICCTLFPIAAITFLCLTKISINNLIPFMPYGSFSIIQAARIVIFSFFGFECAGSLFKIMQDPEKNIGKAFVYSIGIVAFIYLLFTGSMIGAFGAKLIQTHPTELLQTLYPKHSILIKLIDLSIISAIIGTIHAMLWSASYLFHFLIQESSHAGNAWIAQPQKNALLLALFIALPLLMISSFGLFFNLTALVVVSAYVLCMVGLVITPAQRSKTSIIGLITGFIILFVALQGVIESLT